MTVSSLNVDVKSQIPEENLRTELKEGKANTEASPIKPQKLNFDSPEV